MAYLSLPKAFHGASANYESLYKQRFNSENAIHLGIEVSGYPAFFLMVPEIYNSIVRISRADKEILRLSHSLPPKAIEQFTMDNLINEIVITNEIEGVNSTRREIGKVLENLKNHDKKIRFRGLVNKYHMLNSGTWDEIVNPADIRKAYDELVLAEIQEADPKNAPDGKMFRKESVSVYSPSQKEIHKGIMPEEAIIKNLSKALDFLNGNSCQEPIAKISAFHFLFGYIHPFYDGNGRMNRFVSSQYITNICEPVVGYGISYTIKKRLSEYYKAFIECEDKLARGDITPFVITFSEILAESVERIQSILQDKYDMFSQYTVSLQNYMDQDGISKQAKEIAYVILQATLFASDGITIREMMSLFSISSRNTVYRKLREVESAVPLHRTRLENEVHFSINLELLDI